MKKILFLSIALIVSLITLYSVISYKNSFGVLNISVPSRSTLSIYVDEGQDSISAIKKDPVYVSTNTNFTKKLKHGSYIYIISPENTSFKSITSSLDFTEKSKSISVSFNLTPERLQDIADQETSDIANIISGYLGGTSFTVGKVEAYLDGTWFGVRLNPKEPNVDTYLSIFKDDNGVLTLVTNPPSLVIAAPVYPNIPYSVIENTNNMVNDLYRD